MKKLLFLSVLFLSLFSLAHAEEKINSFDVTLQVQNDGSLIVTENISVFVEHYQIKRGIYRDIPQTRHSAITPLSLSFDGSNHPYFTENKGKALRVNFGDDNYIPLGRHTYSFKYQVTNAVGQFRNYDEIYWNVTGNYWNFPIEQATATVILPSGAQPIQDKISLYTGSSGTKGTDAKETGYLLFAVTRPLNQGEGFTVAVPWQKGIITMPSVPWQQRPAFIVTACIAALWIYFYLAWVLVGRDPQERVVRQYAPPKDISPAFARYLTAMRRDDKNFAVILISMALKGAITITQSDLMPDALQNSFVGKLLSGIKGPYVLHAQDISQGIALSKEESAVYNSFFSGTVRQVTLTQSSRTAVLSAFKAADTALAEQESGYYFKTNYIWFLPAFAPLVFFIYKIWQLSAEYLFYTVLVGFFLMFFTAMISNTLKNIKRMSFFALVPIGLVGLFFINMFMGVALSFKGFSSIDPDLLWYIAGFLVVLIGNAVFVKLIRAYSVEGRAVMDEIEGFKQYLSAVEDRRAEVSDPTDSQKMFCDYFAYAVALDVENKWIKGFEAALGAAVMEQTLRRRGIMTSSFGTSAGLASFGSSLSSAVSTSGSSSRSSGSGGGGSSGGGGGGGGGGGR